MIRYLLLGLLILLAGYGTLEARPLLNGPTIALSSPAPYASIAGGTVTVAGRALRAVVLLVDGSPVLPDQNGDFSTSLTLPAGGSILTLTARDRFGRAVALTRTVYVP
jgi:hypothetical protein